jgi:hypothetical protein
LAWATRRTEEVLSPADTLFEFAWRAETLAPQPAARKELLADLPRALSRPGVRQDESEALLIDTRRKYVRGLDVALLLKAVSEVRNATIEQARTRAREQGETLKAGAETAGQGQSIDVDELVERSARALAQSPSFVAAASALEKLERWRGAIDPKNERGLSVEDLEEEVARAAGVQLPYIDERLSGELAVVLISLGLAGPFLYLLSLFRAMRTEIAYMEEVEGNDWLFFHPGRLGVGLGAAWLAGPSLSIWARCYLQPHGFKQIALATSLSVLAAFTLERAIRTRRSYLHRLTTLRAREPAGTTDGSPPGGHPRMFTTSSSRKRVRRR